MIQLIKQAAGYTALAHRLSMHCRHVWMWKITETDVFIMTIRAGCSDNRTAGRAASGGGQGRRTGTTVNFLPDPQIFERTDFQADEVKSRLHETAYLNPTLTIVFDDERQETPEHVVYHEPEGIIGFIQDLNRKKETVHPPVYFKGETKGLKWKWHSSMSMSSMRMCWASAIIFIMQREEHI